MEQLVLPVRHEWLTRERARGQIAIEPFEPGFAITVGNAYRRVLLSSIPGAVPTWVKIEAVLHEFSHLQGVNEDTLDIVMNLRKLVFAVSVSRPKLLRLKAQGRPADADGFRGDEDPLGVEVVEEVVEPPPLLPHPIFDRDDEVVVHGLT